MYIYIYVYMYIYVIYMYIYVYIYTHGLIFFDIATVLLWMVANSCIKMMVGTC